MAGTYREPIPRSVVEDVLSEPACAYCGCHATGVVDHIHPVARGGGNDRANLTRACSACNSEKASSTVAEWRQRRVDSGREWPPPNTDKFSIAWSELATEDETAVLLPAIDGRCSALADFMLEARARFRNDTERPFEQDMAEALSLAREFNAGDAQILLPL